MPSRRKKKSHRGILYKSGRIWIQLTHACSDFGGQGSYIRKSNDQIQVVRKECFLRRWLSVVGVFFSVTNSFSCLGISTEILLQRTIQLCCSNIAQLWSYSLNLIPIWAYEVPEELESSPTCTRPPEEFGLWLTGTGNLSPWDENT